MSEIEDWMEADRPFLPFAVVPTHLYSIYNSRMYHYFVLARDKKDALTILEREGHVVSKRLARIKLADPDDWVPEMAKFFAASAQASVKRAQGIVENMNGFAVMKRNGQVYMPLSLVAE